MRHRDLVLVVLPWALVLAVVGCATMNNTLAQDLAWERWQQCKHISGVTLKDIKADGTIWVYYHADLTAWRECDRQGAAAQGTRRVGTSTPIPPSHTVAAATTQGPITLPVWKVGNE
jgi:hypothetical protein